MPNVIVQKAIALWGKIPPGVQTEIISASHTFFGTFAGEVVLQVHSGNIPMSRDAIASLVFMATRSAWKATVVFVAPWVKAKGIAFWNKYLANP